MKHVKLIRHGESAANAGEPTRDHASTPLTAKGMEQDHMVAQSITRAPDLILASPFMHAQATSLATIPQPSWRPPCLLVNCASHCYCFKLGPGCRELNPGRVNFQL